MTARRYLFLCITCPAEFTALLVVLVVVRSSAELDADERLALRRQQSRPLPDQPHAWLLDEKDAVLPVAGQVKCGQGWAG